MSDKFIMENEIRPANLMQEQDRRLRNDIKRLLYYRDKFITVSCPACACKDANKAFEKYELTYVECSECQTIYINPRPTTDILNYYYTNSENYEYWNNYIFPASEVNRREKIFKPRVERILELCQDYNIEHDCLLEVGAGFGTFCEEILKKGRFRRVIAVEPTPDLAESCRTRGLETIESPIEEVVLKDGEASVIVSFEVIEHLFSPIDFIKSCYRILAPGGLLVLTCPNIKGFDIRILKEYSNTIDNEHLNYFHPGSLTLLLNNCGLEVVEISTPGKLDAELVRNKVLEGVIDFNERPFLKQLLLDEWERLGKPLQNFITANNLSSHMWAIARKKRK